jgi:acylphosphatase
MKRLSRAAAAMAETVLRLEIRGRVQGVGYRAAMVEQARRLGLRGWVRNRRDGSVEAVVAGTEPSLQRIVAWARCGPRGARVSEVITAAGEGSFDTFEQRPSL